MRGYRIQEKDGSYTFTDVAPRRRSGYDIVNIKLPTGAIVYNFGEEPEVLRRIKLPGNTYTHLESIDGTPVLVEDSMRNGISMNTAVRFPLEYDLVEENLRCDFECLATRRTADNIYRLNYMDGKYWIDDLYGRRIVSKQDALKYKVAWS